MGRSVVLAGAARCEGCRLPPRWCVCLAMPPAVSGIQVDVLMHRREQWKPSSTGKLIQRTVAGARCHIYGHDSRSGDRPGLPADVLLPDRELWILHPRGEPIPVTGSAAGGPSPLQVLLLDGNWPEAGQMLRAVEGRGRCVRLTGALRSRYWLRDQQEPTHRSTAEALLGIFQAVGDAAAETCFRLHFELHVYATLRARGRRQLAEEYLQDSPLGAAIPEFLERLNTRRPER